MGDSEIVPRGPSSYLGAVPSYGLFLQRGGARNRVDGGDWLLLEGLTDRVGGRQSGRLKLG